MGWDQKDAERNVKTPKNPTLCDFGFGLYNVYKVDRPRSKIYVTLFVARIAANACPRRHAHTDRFLILIIGLVTLTHFLSRFLRRRNATYSLYKVDLR